jgi:hypothetical protein
LFLCLYCTTQHKLPCPQRDSNPQYQQASGHRPTSWTARPRGSSVQPVLPYRRRYCGSFCSGANGMIQIKDACVYTECIWMTVKNPTANLSGNEPSGSMKGRTFFIVCFKKGINFTELVGVVS